MKKRELAEHVKEWHPTPEGRMTRCDTPLADLLKWRKDELEAAHNEFHGEGTLWTGATCTVAR